MISTTASEKLFSRARELMAGGVNSPVRAFRSVGGTPIFMNEGSGAWITDADGNHFIDYCMSWGPLILGHAPEAVLAALNNVMKRGTSFGAPHEGEIKLARLVIEKHPSIEKIRFVNSGTEATMSAIRLARGFTGRNEFIKFDGCYHGHADHLLVAAGSGVATLSLPDSAGVTPGAVQDTHVLPFNDIDALDAAFSHFGSGLAAVIMEPVPCNYGLILPDRKFLEKARELCTKNGTVLIFDEVITGFRLGPGGAQDYYGIHADLTTLGKIIGGGLPVGAYGGRSDIMAMVAPDGPVYQAGTLSGNPLAMAAGAAVLETILSEQFYPALNKTGELLDEKLKTVLGPYRESVLITRIGSIFAFSFTHEEKLSRLDQVKACDMERYARFHRAMLDRGVYLAPSGYEVAFLSAAHGEHEIDLTVEAVRQSLELAAGGSA